MRPLIFLCGLILGIFGLLSAQNLGFLRTKPPPPPIDAGLVAPLDREADASRTDGPSIERYRAALEQDLKDPQGQSLDPLAVLLEEALIERNWAKVQAAAETVRAHGAEWMAPPVATPPVPPEEKSLFDLSSDLAARQVEVGLATRRNRATALARSRDPAAGARLLEILRTSGDEQERLDAALLLAKSGDEHTVETLVLMLSDHDRPIRIAAGRALAGEGYLTGARELVRLAGTSPESEVRLDAIDALSRYRVVETGESRPGSQALLDALRKDEADGVRAAAAAFLGRTDLARVRIFVDGLLDALVTDDSPAVREAAAATIDREARTVGLFPGAVRVFERALRAEKVPATAQALLGFLRDFGDGETLRAIDAYAATPEAKALGAAVAEVREELRARLAAAR